MGVTYRATALLGISIDLDVFKVGTRKVKTFEHNHPESMNFDPVNGKALWESETVYHEAYRDSGYVDGKWQEETFGGFEVFRNGHIEDNVWLVVKIAGNTSSNGGKLVDFFDMASIVELEDAANRMMELLHPLGAWDKSKFGVYSILDGG